MQVADRSYDYKFGAKELQDELDLNMYDFGARFYDPASPRWWQIDPMAEKYYNLSPYNYTANNPVYFVDKEGKWIDISGLSKEHKEAFRRFLTTQEGRRFLLLYGSAGQDILGYHVEKDGKYSKHTVWYESKENQYGTDKGGMTHAYVKSRNTGKWLRRGNLTSTNATQTMGFVVQIGPGESEDKATVTIGHESLVHVKRITEEYGKAVEKFNNGGYAEESEKTGVSQGVLFLADAVSAMAGEGDHKLFVNGKNVNYETFIKELTEMYNTNKYKEQSDKDKEITRKADGL